LEEVHGGRSGVSVGGGEEDAGGVDGIFAGDAAAEFVEDEAWDHAGVDGGKEGACGARFEGGASDEEFIVDVGGFAVGHETGERRAEGGRNIGRGGASAELRGGFQKGGGSEEREGHAAGVAHGGEGITE
jgi:hypothetical protein